MPRNVDPGTIVVGAGLAPEGTVEDNSLRYPERDVDPLRVHLHDTSRAHMAVAIGIDDAGHCYTSDEVEGALQEICAAAGASRMNGMVNGGYFVELGPPSTAAIQAAISGGGVGTTLTLVEPTTVLVNTHVLHLGGMTITLPDDAVSFVYVDCDGTHATYETLVSTLAPPPQIDSGGWPGVEHVMIAKITTVGGIVTAYQDARFFVADLDRKLAYSVRAVPGEPDNDLYAEACFVTLEASLFWMEWYHTNAMDGQDTRTRILLRGTQTVFAPLVVPLNNVVFQGDGDAKIVFPGGFAGTTLFDVSDRIGVEFRDLEFVSSVATNNTAIWANGATTASSGLRVTNCQFAHTGGVANRWTTGISVESSASSPSWILVQDCQMMVSGAGVRIDSGASCTIQGCLVAGVAGVTPVGIDLPATQHGLGSDNRVLDCEVKDCATAIRATDSKRLHVEGCQLEADDDGIIIRAATQSFDLEENVIEGTVIKLADTTTALCGIVFDHSAIIGPMTKNAVIDCLIENQRTAGWAAGDFSWGIDFRSFGGDEIGVLNRISGCTIQGFNNPAAALLGISGGVRLDAAADQTRIVDTAFHLCANGIYFDAGSGNVAQGVSVEGCKYTASTNTDSGLCAGFTFLYQFDDLGIIGNTLHCLGNADGSQGAILGVYVGNPEDNAGTGLRIANNQVTGMGYQTGAMRPAGIQVDGFWTNVNVSDNTIDGFIGGGGGHFPNGAGVSFTPRSLAPHDVVVSGNAITRCLHGITAAGVDHTHFASTYNITGNTISYCAGPISDSTNVVMLDRAVFGIAMEFCEDFMVSSNVISDCGSINFPNGSAAVPAGTESTIGICALNCTQYSIHGNRIHELISTGVGITIPIQARNDGAGVGAAGTWASRAVSICNNEIKGAGNPPWLLGAAAQLWGISVSSSAFGDAADSTYIINDLTISDNTITGLRSHAVTTIGSIGIWVGARQNAEISKVAVQGNLVSGCEWFSIWLDADAKSTTPGYFSFIRDADVSNNVIGAQHSVSDATAGIFVQAADAGRVQHANISNNNISNVPDRGIYLKSDSDNSVLSGIRVVGNTIPYIPVGDHGSFGIELESVSDVVAEVQDVVISGNTIGGRLVFDSGSSNFMVHTGIKVFNEECSKFLRVHVDDNEIAATAYGVHWQVASTAAPGSNLTVRWPSINRNTIHYAPQDGITIWDFRPIFVDSFGAHWEDAEFIGNQVRSACTPLVGPAVPLTVHLYGDNNPSTAPYHFTNIKINDNTAENTSETTDVPNTESILLHIASAKMDVHGIQINRNTTQGGGINCLLDHLDVEHDEISDINICNNAVNGNLARIGIKFNTKDVPILSPQPISNVKIDGNTIESLATGITFAPTTESSYGILVATTGAEAPIRGCSISNNTVDGTLSSALSAAWGVTGIKMVGAGCRAMSIHGNTLVNLRGDDKQTRGIWYNCLSGDSTQALTVDGNTVNGAGGSGIELQFGGDDAGVHAGEDDSISCCNNNLRLVTTGSDPGIPGILIHAAEGTDTTLKNVQVHGNQVEVGDSQIGIQVDADGWDDNYSISCCDNTVSKNYGKVPNFGILGSFANNAEDVRFDGNTCVAWKNYGVMVFAPLVMRNFSLSRNLVRTGNTEKASFYSGVRLYGDALTEGRNTTLDGNIVDYIGGNLVGANRGVVFTTDNIALLGGADCQNTSISGNKIMEASYAVWFGGEGANDAMSHYNTNICDNQVVISNSNPQYAPVSGIKVLSGANQTEFQGMTLSRNQVSVSSNDHDYKGIDILIGGVDGLNSLWDVSDNQINYLNPLVDTAQDTTGIYWENFSTNGLCHQMRIARNTVVGAGRWGIAVGFFGDTREVQILDNIIHSSRNTFTGGYGYHNGDLVIEWQLGSTLKALSVCGNHCRNGAKHPDRYGFVFSDAGLPGTIGKWIISNNTSLNYEQFKAVNTTFTNPSVLQYSNITDNINMDMTVAADNWDNGLNWADPTNVHVSNNDVV